MWLVKVAAAVTGFFIGANVVHATVSYIDNKAQQLADSVK